MVYCCSSCHLSTFFIKTVSNHIPKVRDMGNTLQANYSHNLQKRPDFVRGFRVVAVKQAGQNVLTPFPHTDLSRAKLRPVLMLRSASRYGDWRDCAWGSRSGMQAMCEVAATRQCAVPDVDPHTIPLPLTNPAGCRKILKIFVLAPVNIAQAAIKNIVIGFNVDAGEKRKHGDDPNGELLSRLVQSGQMRGFVPH